MVDRATALGGFLLGVPFPPTCAGCGVIETWMCRDCERLLKRIDQSSCCRNCGYPGVRDEICPRCAEGWSLGVWTRGVFEFDGPARDTIHKLKYGGEYARAIWASRELARVLLEVGWEPDLLTAVPLWKDREKARGFNQAEKLANELQKISNLRHESALVRIRDTGTQVGRTLAEREANVRDAFTVDSDLRGQSVLIVDDVLTTGATLRACAAACRKAGASKVFGLTLAMATSDRPFGRPDRQPSA